MIYLINDNRCTESHFWNCLHGLASESQIKRILEGQLILIGGITYKIEFNNEEG